MSTANERGTLFFFAISNDSSFTMRLFMEFVLNQFSHALLAFYDFPAEHWRPIRTTNPIESTFATIRLRHRRTKGSGSRTASLTMMFKLAESASKRWRQLNGSQLLPAVLQGIPFKDGIQIEQDAA